MSHAPYYVQVVGQAGRVTYLTNLGTGNYSEVEDHRFATFYSDEDEAADVCDTVAETHFAGQHVLLTVCSADEFEGD